MTTKQKRIVVLVSQGLKDNEIAICVGASVYAIKAQVRRIFDELGFHNRVELALWQVKREADAIH